MTRKTTRLVSLFLAATLRKSRVGTFTFLMVHRLPVVSVHRKKSGLSQRELAFLLGYKNGGQVSRHEAGILPSLYQALHYQAIFQVPLTELFPEIHLEVRTLVEKRFEQLEQDLNQQTPKGRDIALIAHKLEWIWNRKNSTRSQLA